MCGRRLEWQQLDQHLHRGGRGVCLAGGPADRSPLPPPNQTEQRWVGSLVPPESLPLGCTSQTGRGLCFGLPLPWLCSPFTRLKYGWAPTMQHHCSRPHSLTEPLLMWELGRCQGGKRVSRRKRYFPGAPGRLLLSPYLSRLCAQPPGRRLEGSGENTTTYFPGCGEN